MKDNYSAWEIKASDFPKNGTIEEKITFILGYGILAPSTHNTQPWLFAIADNTLEIKPDLRCTLPFGDPTGRNLYISLGCCLENILLAAEHFGMDASYNIITDKHFQATIRLNFEDKKATKSTSQSKVLFPYITQRFSNKLSYMPESIDSTKLTQLEKFTNADCTLSFITQPQKIHEIASLYRQSAFKYSKKPEFRKELLQWMRPNHTKSYDGMPGFANGFSAPQVAIGKLLLRWFPPFAKVPPKKYEVVISNSPGVGYITTAKDEPSAWIESGKLYQQFALKSVSLGLATTFLAAIIEDSTNRLKLNTFAVSNAESKLPQIFFRIGVSSKEVTLHTPRRKVTDVID